MATNSQICPKCKKKYIDKIYPGKGTKIKVIYIHAYGSGGISKHCVEYKDRDK